MKYLSVILIIINLHASQSSRLHPNYDENNYLAQNYENLNCTDIVEQNMEHAVITQENDIISLRWDGTAVTEDCNITYQLKIFDEGRQIYEKNTTQAIYDVDFPFVGCKLYNLVISAYVNYSKVLLRKLPFIFSKAPNPPDCNVAEVGNNYALLACTLGSIEENMCPISEILITCQVSSSDMNRDMTYNKSWTQAIKNRINHRPFQIIKIGDIKEYTAYTCSSTLKNNDGLISSSSIPFSLQTKEGVPDAPLLYNISSITNTTFTIQWKSPQNIPGILTNYRITVQPIRPNYYSPEECLIDNNVPEVYEVSSLENEYAVTNASPAYKYDVFVEAKTFDYGPPSEIKQILTLGGIPSEPKDVTFNVINKKGSGYNVSVNITWKYPCNARDEIQYFQLLLVGYPNVDYDVGEDNHTLSVYAKKETTTYASTFDSLEPAFNYSLILKSVTGSFLESDSVVRSFNTPEYIPGAPIITNVTDKNHDSFTIEWNKPIRKNGKLTAYNLYIHSNGPNHWIPLDCQQILDLYEYIIPPNETSFTFKNGMPDYNYTIMIRATVHDQNGSFSESYNTNTLDSESEEVRNLKIIFINRQQEYYNGHVNISFQIPCNTNGEFEKIVVTLTGNRENKKTHTLIHSLSSILQEYNFLMDIKAEYNYVLTVQVVTKNFIKSSTHYFVSPSGAPLLGIHGFQKPIQVTSTKAKFNVSKDIFDDSSGDILYYSVIIGQFPNSEESRYGFWNGDKQTWPEIPKSSNDGPIQPFELTPKFWNPFFGNNESVYSFVIGDDTTRFALQSNIVYTIKVRGFTKDGYRDSPTVTFQLTDDYDATAIIFGSIFGILGTAMLLGSVFILWRKRKRWALTKESIKSIPLSPIPISVKNFPQYYNELSNDAERLKHEYTLLSTKSNEITSSTSCGLLAQNKKKNRYTNVIAYDHSRVQLKDIDDSTTDYINASYIKGFSGNTEYIASQGPLQHTVIDFWNMVIQENVSLIVMVAQFVEQNKDKCYKYFPNNHENMELENGITIRCCTELDFKTYTVRTLTAQNDVEQWTITHLQFTDWPDFGCPNGTEVMLEFCQLMREYAEKTEAPIILHCSAGIGRTGTIIALDILLQCINEKKDIDIFNTVLNLRRDRKNMVQTEKQYLYIHSCISDAIVKPLPIKTYIQTKEPIYENVEEIKKGLNDVDIKESKF